jgi:predicted dehydrogenase
MTVHKRRTFLKTAGLGALALSVGGRAAGAVDLNEKLVLGIIGTGGMGSAHLTALARRKDAKVAYVCDVDKNRLADATKTVLSVTDHAPTPVDDLRRLLDDRDVDAVYIATPDHWHAPAAILALDAGKHVYVEKPCSHNVREGRLMVDAAKQSGKVLQVGMQSRSAPFLKDAIQRLHDGEIGEVLVAKAWNSQRRSPIGKTQPSRPPAHLNFDGWVGPAPMVPYRSNLLHGVWRWWYAFGCGDIGNDGVHDIDVALWGLDVRAHPTRVTCFGGKSFFDDDQQFPDTQYAICEYPCEGAPKGRSKRLIFEQRLWSPYVQEGYEAGAAFYGTHGLLLVGHVKGWRLYGEGNKLVAEAAGQPTLDDHYSNFFDCIRGAASKPAVDALTGHYAATVCHLANISARVGRVLSFDPQNEIMLDDEQANEMLRRRYRDGHWAVPRGIV